MEKTAEKTLDAEVTIRFVLSDVCFESDLTDETHFYEIVEDMLLHGNYELDFEENADIITVKTVS